MNNRATLYPHSYLSRLALEPLLSTELVILFMVPSKYFATLMFVLGYCDDLFIFTTLLGLSKWMRQL